MEQVALDRCVVLILYIPKLICHDPVLWLLNLSFSVLHVWIQVCVFFVCSMLALHSHIYCILLLPWGKYIYCMTSCFVRMPCVCIISLLLDPLTQRNISQIMFNTICFIGWGCAGRLLAPLGTLPNYLMCILSHQFFILFVFPSINRHMWITGVSYFAVWNFHQIIFCYFAYKSYFGSRFATKHDIMSLWTCS